MDTPRNARMSRPALWVLSFSQLPIMLVYANYPTAIPILKAEWSLTNADAGFIYFMFYVGYVVASAVLTGATDYFSARHDLSLFGSLARFHEPHVPILRPRVCGRPLFSGAPAGLGLAGVFGPGLRIVGSTLPRFCGRRWCRAYAFFFTFSVSVSMFRDGLSASRFRLALHLRRGFARPHHRNLDGADLGARPGQGGIGKAVRNSPFRRLPLRCWVLIGSYVMHRWELFAFRGWGVTFLASAFLAHGLPRGDAVDNAATALAFLIAISAFSNFIGAWSADRFGRLRSIGGSLFLSGAMTYGIGFLFHAPIPALLIVLLVWAVIMAVDASVFLVVMSEIAPKRHLGTALGCLAGFGFLFGALSSIEVGYILDITNPGSRGEVLPTEWTAAWASWAWPLDSTGRTSGFPYTEEAGQDA